MNSTKHLKKNLSQSFSNSSTKENGKLSNSFQEASHYHDTKSRQRYKKKKNCKWISHEIGAKILSKIPADQIQNHMKRIIHQGLEYIHLG